MQIHTFYSRLALRQGPCKVSLGETPSQPTHPWPPSLATIPFSAPVPGPALLPPDGKGRSAERGLSVCVTSLGRGGGGRDSGPSLAPVYAGGNPGQHPWEPGQSHTDAGMPTAETRSRCPRLGVF